MNCFRPAFERMRQEDHRFQANLKYVVARKNKTNQTTGQSLAFSCSCYCLFSTHSCTVTTSSPPSPLQSLPLLTPSLHSHCLFLLLAPDSHCLFLPPALEVIATEPVSYLLAGRVYRFQTCDTDRITVCGQNIWVLHDGVLTSICAFVHPFTTFNFWTTFTFQCWAVLVVLSLWIL